MSMTGRISLILVSLLIIVGCGTGGEVVKVKTVSEESLKELSEAELARLEEIKEAAESEQEDFALGSVIKETPNYSVSEYLSLWPKANNAKVQDYKVGGYDVMNIKVYEEDDLTRENLPVSADGYISMPLIGRVKVGGLSPAEIEKLISRKLVEGQYILDAHVSVTVGEYRSKQFMVLGSVNSPGTYPLQYREKVLDAISRAGGIDFEQGGKGGMIIRTLNSDTAREKKIVVRVDLQSLLKGGDQTSNLLLHDKDLLYISKLDFYYIIGQVNSPGKYPYQEKEITLVEAIVAAGGFTPIASPNRTRIIRVEDGAEKIIQVKVKAITDAGMKEHDVLLKPNDIIVVPESFF